MNAVPDTVLCSAQRRFKQKEPVLLKGAVRVSPALFTVCEGIYNPRTVPVTPDEALEICFRQVSRFRDHDDGSVSGKGSGEEDDAGMALLLATQWSMSVLDWG